MKPKNDKESIYLFGKVSPQAIDLEEAVLGAIMLDREAMSIVCEILTEDCFYSTQHQVIYKAMTLLYTDSQPIDLLTVMEKLKRLGELEKAGGPVYLANLTNKVASAANIEYHARIIYQKYLRRKIAHISSNLIEISFDESEDEFDILAYADEQLSRISGNLHGQGIITSATVSMNLFNTQKRILEIPEGEVVGVPSGLDLDKVLAGFRSPDLVIIAARPGMGKSAFVTTCIRQQAVLRGIPVGVFSLEMSAEQQQTRIASTEADIANSVLQDPRKMTGIQRHLYAEALARIAESPIYYCDTPAITLTSLKSKAREMVRKHNVKIIYIDYLQLMSGGDSRGNREQEISTISRGIKALAKELNIPIIALSQLSRAVETRGGSKKPQLSDLRESGSLEQDADIVGFLYRPEYYGIMQDEDGNNTKEYAEFIIAKHRNGALKDVPLRFNASRVSFSNWEVDDWAKLNDEDNSKDFIYSSITPANTDEDLPF